MRSLSVDETLRLRMKAQRLDRPDSGEAEGVAQVVRAVCGLQAQEAPSAALGVRARSSGLTAMEVERARVEERRVVRTWCQRGTLHLLSTEDLGWLLPLLGPIFTARSRRRYRELGWDEETGEKGLRVLREALAKQGPLTKEEISRLLAARGLPAEGQAPIHLLGRAALEGLVCLGPDREGKPAYTLLQEWVRLDSAPTGEAALGELARRYLKAYAPAGPEDLASWSGLPAGEARRAWGLVSDGLIQVEAAGRPAWILKEQQRWVEELPDDEPAVRLLGRFDAYLLGYASRDLALATEHARRIHPGGGILHPALVVDGRVIGTWRSVRKKRDLEVALEPFEALRPEIRPALAVELEDLGRFLGCEVFRRKSVESTC